MNFTFHALAGGTTFGGVCSSNFNPATGALQASGVTQPYPIGTVFSGQSTAGSICFFDVLITVGGTLTNARIDYTDTGVTNTLKAGSWMAAMAVL